MDSVERAVALLGPLEGRIMRAVWTGAVAEPFVVADMQALLPELAYTTVMTTVKRLAGKGLLQLSRDVEKRAYEYHSSGSAEEYLAGASRAAAANVVDRYGDAALAAFAAQLADLPPEQVERLRKLAR
ncbi:BlaI/MecI/CopY family transcriptional regulator [Amycolatopsis rhizosphaerae]|uniref:BlaI/MecI/CopY family transcriptional regulator n=1 Tax=Amycolatopsis rhizosphaerae TaxID=2053003 RepID=A0A558DE97_9PSEU|nr:BlaI/MecI/CopY family transcriptional regulator [Amycolatopsis rhizosphaerae]TVT59336.1 BlaI/MecI/CopY family transcriptional regulator [Amycolatopsis rhizosphaerae]